jgi:hypothetical protein
VSTQLQQPSLAPFPMEVLPAKPLPGVDLQPGWAQNVAPGPMDQFEI